MPSSFLDRYLSGEYEEVWSDLFALGEEVRTEPYYSDALAVARETMNRVKFNVNLLIKHLRTLGYVFGTFPDGINKVYGYTSPINLPKHDVSNKIGKLEKLEGITPFPLSLKVFWEVVGEVNLIGYHPSWPKFSDPLVVYSYEIVEYEYDLWRERVGEGDMDVGMFSVPISPDYYHKSNVSGGEAYKILLPNGSIDAFVENERHNTTFVNYLRIAFQHGGFPGVEWPSRVFPNDFIYDDLKPI